MAKAWRNEAAAKINAGRKAGSKEGSARMQKNERLFIAKVWPIKAADNWLLAGLLERIGIWATAPGHIQEPRSYNHRSEVVVPKESILKSFLRKAKSFFTGK